MSITVRLCGGMANQAIQASAGLAAAQRLETDLRFNISSFHEDKMRQYSLGLWKGFQNVPLDTYPPQPPFVIECGLPFSQKLKDSVVDGCTMVGYFQTEQYFKEIKPLLKVKFVPNQPLTDRAKNILEHIKYAGHRSTFLTIRRTDYLNSDFHGVLGWDYYYHALWRLRQKLNDDPIVFIFSDDPKWCEDHICDFDPIPAMVCGNYDLTTKDHLGREDEELTLMAACHNAICANSSYSWLAAWLGPDEEGGSVICPKRWFGSESNEDPRDIIPDRWIKI